MFEEIEKLEAEGLYEKALNAAKRLSIDLLKQNRRDASALALCRAATILCALNNPAKARGFTQEALELATKANAKHAASAAHAVSALAFLRLGEIEKAEAALDVALDPSAAATRSPEDAAIRLIGAEISLAKEDFVEARAFARDAHDIAGSLDHAALKARALLVRAIAEERTDNASGAVDLLKQAETELSRAPHVEVAWQVKSAMASVFEKSKNDKAAAEYRRAASDLIDRIATQLSTEAHDRYLKNPAVATAIGAEATSSGIFRAPVQVQQQPRKRKEETGFQGLRPVLEVIKKINSELNLRKLITTILDTMIEFCNAERGTIVVFEGDRFKVELSRDRHKVDLKRDDIGISSGILKLVRDKGKKIVADDAQQDPDLRLIDSVQEQQLLSILCLPLRVKLRLVGAIYLDNPRVTGAFGPREIEIAEILTDHAAVAIDNALLHIKSIHDNLTNLLNHGHFEKRLEGEVARCRRHNRPCSVLMLDVDDFKGINDQHGHEAGNEALRSVARVLANAVRNVDLVARIQEREKDLAPVVARYGGDEFEIILPEADRAGAQKVADRILQSLAETRFHHNGTDIKITFSIGGATFPEDAPDHRELMLKADEALYEAKRRGKNRYSSYGERVEN